MGLSLRTRVHVMTLARTNESINKAEVTGRWMPKSGFAYASRRAFLTTVSSYPEFCGWICQET